MGLSAFNAARARLAAQQKALEDSKILDEVVVEPTSPVDTGEVATPTEPVKPEIIEEVKPKKKRK